MKTILHITEVFSGGVFPVIAGICNGLCDKYRFVIAYGIRDDTPQNLAGLFDKRVKLIPIDSLHLKMSGDDLRAIRELRNIVGEEKPDIIHIHSTKAGIVARLGLLGDKTTKYYTPHGFSFLRKDQGMFKPFILRMMEAFLAKRCDGIIACGYKEFQEAKRLSKNAILIENGLDTDYIDEIVKEQQPKSQRFTVYTAGRIGPQKNPSMFNEIATKMPDISFVWIGEGEGRKQLSSPNIEITGLLPRAEVIRRAVNYDCYLSTSLWEGLPIALMEAMYLEKKCVVSDVDGNN